ncbi:hypothetical protein [Bacteriovorax sp. DB6_IX]|uniref:hypothetical protein n=1 Tax=Bacteriovorax sp. DB6_IX TaxID=1353530 RepID=UPI000389F7A9|nr:hypothetical protein [Bacteriovorax sp. DB6_IX]EQC51106.1 hypothetical protein M901_2095 [Bacteriovorax sp. DB6_IX]
MPHKYKIILALLLSFNIFAQGGLQGIDDDDLNIGGDIFSDFNEDLENTQIMEDERFFKYGRFFSFSLFLGVTQFDGNRGEIYDNDPPTFGMSINYFSDFQSSWGFGFAFSKHSYFINEATDGFDPDGPGFVEVSMLRSFFSYRYYIDTSNLGTAITYSNPYLTARVEYWYVTNKYLDLDTEPDDKGGGIGVALGFGLEFPIKLKESYINIELLLHDVAFHDKNTQDLAPKDGTTAGVSDLSGYAYTTTVGYVWNW